MTPRLSLSHLSSLDTPPAELVELAARAGYWAVGLRMNPAAPGALQYPLRCGTPELAELKRRIVETGVGIYDVELIPLTPDVDVPSYVPMFEAAAELGARRLNVSGDDPNVDRLAATFARMCETAGRFGLTVDLEFMRWRHVGNLAQAVEVVRRSGATNATVLLDALHLFRSGGTVADVARLAPGTIGCLQLSDAPLADPPEEAIIDEARNRRFAPGEGELPLVELIKALSPTVDLALEVPPPAGATGTRLDHLRHIYQTAQTLVARSG